MPTLTNIVGGSTTNYSVFIGATSDVLSVGDLHWYTSNSATPPIAADLVAGTGSISFGNVAKNANAAQTANCSGLQPATAYYAHMLHDDGAQSNIVSTGPHTTEVAAPIISLPVTTNISASTVTLGCTSDIDVQVGGELRAIIDLPANVDGVFDYQVSQGFNENGTAALSALIAPATGLNPAIVIDASGLTNGVTYGFALVYQDQNDNTSAVLNTGTFVHSTAGGPVVNAGIREICTNASVALADGTVVTWAAYDAIGGTELVEGTTAITGGNGTLQIDNDLLGAVGDVITLATNYSGGSALKTTVSVIDLDA